MNGIKVFFAQLFCDSDLRIKLKYISSVWLPYSIRVQAISLHIPVLCVHSCPIGPYSLSRQEYRSVGLPLPREWERQNNNQTAWGVNRPTPTAYESSALTTLHHSRSLHYLNVRTLCKWWCVVYLNGLIRIIQVYLPIITGKLSLVEKLNWDSRCVVSLSRNICTDYNMNSFCPQNGRNWGLFNINRNVQIQECVVTCGM